MKFIFSRSISIYRVEHSTINFIFPRAHLLFSIYYTYNDLAKIEVCPNVRSSYWRNVLTKFIERCMEWVYEDAYVGDRISY